MIMSIILTFDLQRTNNPHKSPNAGFRAGRGPAKLKRFIAMQTTSAGAR